MNEQHEAKMRERGKQDGLAAASWFFDGNTPDSSYVEVLKGIEDGDPMIMDSLPFADLSGQHADSPTAESIARDELSEEEFEELSHSQHHDELVDELITVYEDAFSVAAQDEIVRVCRLQTTPV